nr:hypothetical protein GCM10020063_036980 [Dactylosporangium thailandense]
MSLYTLGSGAPVLQASWADLVAGDVVLLNGQSNAAAQKRFQDSSRVDASRRARTFGSSAAGGSPDYQ